MSALTVACRERIWFPQRIFVTTTPFTFGLIRVFEADVTSVIKQQYCNKHNLDKILIFTNK